MPDAFGYAAIATKLLLYLGVLTSTGLVFAALLFAAPLQSIKTDIRDHALGFGALGLLATGLGFSIRGAALTGDASGLVDPEMLGILLKTPVGTAFYLRLSGLSALILGVLVGSKGYWLALLGGLVAISGFVVIGHVPGLEVFWLQLLLMAHLSAAAFWVGVLIPLRRLTLSSDHISQAAQLGRSFGRVASVAVPVLLVAGIVLSWQLVGSIQALFMTGYGVALLVKVTLVTILLCLAAVNKLRFVPLLEQGNMGAAASLARSIRFEWLCIFGILLVTAILTSGLSVPSY